MEIWKDIINFDGYYQISNLGNVRSLDRVVMSPFKKDKRLKGNEMKFGKTPSGYLFVGLKKNGKVKQMYAHRLVAIHFIPNPENKETVNHIDGDKSNNNDWNLEWNTRSENTKHAFNTGLMKNGQDCSFSKLTNIQVLEIRENKNNIMFKDLAVIYNVSKSTIGDVFNRKKYKSV